MGLNDSNAENKQSVNDCSEIEILTGLLTIFNPKLSWCTHMAGLHTHYTKASQSHNNVLNKVLKDPVSCTYIGRFELVDDGSFAAVVQTQAQNVDLLLP